MTAVEAIFEPITLLFLFLPAFLFFRAVLTSHIEYILQLAVDNLLLPLPVGVEDSKVPAVDNHGHLQVILVVFAKLGHLDDPLAAREVPGQVLVLVVEFVIDRCDLLPRGDLVGVAAVLLRCVQDALHQLQMEVFALVAVLFYQQGLAVAQPCHQGRAFHWITLEFCYVQHIEIKYCKNIMNIFVPIQVPSSLNTQDCHKGWLI